MVLVPVGLCLGALIGFGVVPFVQKLRSRRSGVQPVKAPMGLRIGLQIGLRTGLMILVCAIFVPVMLCLGGYLMEKDLDDYWASKGAWDWWRMPLEYPYELIAVGSLDMGSISNWETDEQPVFGVTRFYKSGNIVAGEIAANYSSYQGQWFSFDCSNGQVAWYDSKVEFHQALDELAVEENMRLYWDSH